MEQIDTTQPLRVHAANYEWMLVLERSFRIISFTVAAAEWGAAAGGAQEARPRVSAPPGW